MSFFNFDELGIELPIDGTRAEDVTMFILALIASIESRDFSRGFEHAYWWQIKAVFQQIYQGERREVKVPEYDLFSNPLSVNEQLKTLTIQLESDMLCFHIQRMRLTLNGDVITDARS